jgi:ubiquinone/menaquinone biosynthesis C-methylase UbiE
MAPPDSFKPGLDYHFLTPAYETLVRPFLGGAWQDAARDVIQRAPKGGRVLDMGCGQGTVLRLIRRQRDDLSLLGTDIDQRMLAVAQRRSAGMGISYLQAPADAQPLDDGSIDVALSTMVFHHLPSTVKEGAFREARRVLKQPGEFLLCDFSRNDRPQGRLGRLSSALRRAVLLLLEPDVRPQLDGQLLELAARHGAAVDTLWFRRRFIALHAIRFPSAA